MRNEASSTACTGVGVLSLARINMGAGPLTHVGVGVIVNIGIVPCNCSLIVQGSNDRLGCKRKRRGSRESVFGNIGKTSAIISLNSTFPPYTETLG